MSFTSEIKILQLRMMPFMMQTSVYFMATLQSNIINVEAGNHFYFYSPGGS